jgi:hypothetical protein
MNEPPDPVIRKTVSLPASTWREIEDYQFTVRIKRDSEAIRRLIELGLKVANAGAVGEIAPGRGIVRPKG